MQASRVSLVSVSAAFCCLLAPLPLPVRPPRPPLRQNPSSDPRATPSPSTCRPQANAARRFFIGGNFKANGSVADATKLISQLNSATIASK